MTTRVSPWGLEPRRRRLVAGGATGLSAGATWAAARIRPSRLAVQARSRYHCAVLRTSAVVTDVAVMAISIIAAYQARAAMVLRPEHEHLYTYLSMILPAMVVIWLACIACTGGYSTRFNFFGAGNEEYRKVLAGTLAAAGLTGTINYFMNVVLSRRFFVLMFVFCLIGILIGRFTLRKALHAARRRGHLNQRVILAGAPVHIDEVARALGRESWLGLRVLGALTSKQPVGTLTPGGVRVLGTETAVAQTVSSLDADMLIGVEGLLGSANDFRRIAWELEEVHVATVVSPALTDISEGRVHLRDLGGLPLVGVEPPHAVEATRFGKRAFDIVGATVALVLLAPALAAISLVIKLHDGGPVIFRQPRVGRDGRTFGFLKFRTMVVDAERIRAEQLENANNTNGVLFKIFRDPRITRPGHSLRRFSLDELPQLVNVLRGDMSLVGPRPALPQEVAQYDDDTRHRLRVRPGLTGLWQVSGRSDLPWEETVRLDLYYVDNWCFLEDLLILGKTVHAVFSGRGAY